jgi:hypothetical protein
MATSDEWDRVIEQIIEPMTVVLLVHLATSFEAPEGVPPRSTRTKKADVAEHPKAFDHVGLLTNEPPGSAELLFI